jgi:hypothetical protein
MTKQKDIGDKGEEIARAYLHKLGYQLLPKMGKSWSLLKSNQEPGQLSNTPVRL